MYVDHLTGKAHFQFKNSFLVWITRSFWGLKVTAWLVRLVINTCVRLEKFPLRKDEVYSRLTSNTISVFLTVRRRPAVYLSPDTGALITHLATRRESLTKKKKTDRKISAKNLSLEYIPVLLYTNLELHERKQKATSRHCSGSNPSCTCSPARPRCRLS